jgi:hypothetical protein
LFEFGYGVAGGNVSVEFEVDAGGKFDRDVGGGEVIEIENGCASAV